VRSPLDAEQRYRRLLDECHRAVYAYCRRRTDAWTAADCAAETFLVAWQRIDAMRLPPQTAVGDDFIIGIGRSRYNVLLARLQDQGGRL
jgi:hypothetical protein